MDVPAANSPQRRHVRRDPAGGPWPRAPKRAASRRASTDPLTLLVLSVLAGAFISFGAIFATTVSAGSIAIAAADGAAAFSAGLPYGVVRLLTGLVFSLGLILVVVGGSRAVHRQQSHRDGLGERQGEDTRPAAQLGHCVRRQFCRRVRDRGADVLHDAVHLRRQARSDWRP